MANPTDTYTVLNDTQIQVIKAAAAAPNDDTCDPLLVVIDTLLNEHMAQAWDACADAAYYDPENRDLVNTPNNPYRNTEQDTPHA